MLRFDVEQNAFVGEQGQLPIAMSDVAVRKLAMLAEGECQLGPTAAAEKFDYSPQQYFQLRRKFREHGVAALENQKRGPKTNYRRTDELVHQVIRHRFLDPEATEDVITQKLQQTGFDISKRSVQKVLAEYGLQKKTSLLRSSDGSATHPGANHRHASS